MDILWKTRKQGSYNLLPILLFLAVTNRGIYTKADSLSESTSCPEGSVFLDDKCRKIVCPLGEFYRGLCLQAACPPGLVWRGKSCQEPSYVTTILEIENVLINEMHEKPIYVERGNTNEFVHHSSTTSSPSSTAISITTLKPDNLQDTTTTHKPRTTPGRGYSGCCTVRTPRICKLYGQKWICFNRQKQQCDSRVCIAENVYLKAPEIKYEHPLLIMPPNVDCPNGVCLSDDGVSQADCSGCASNHLENCSPYCYQYICPAKGCAFLNLNEYCSYYPGQFGCIKEDGCLWNWC